MRKQAGVTLVELLVATVIISIMGAIMFNFLTNRVVESARSQARGDLQDDVRLSLDVINRDIRLGAYVNENNVIADDNAPGAPGDLLSWESDVDTFILASPVQDTNDDVLFEDPPAYITYKDEYIYFVENGTLYKRILANSISGNKRQTTCPDSASGPSCAADIVLARNVADFDIAYYDAQDAEVAVLNEARAVEVALTLERSIFGKTETVTRNVRSVMRNQ